MNLVAKFTASGLQHGSRVGAESSDVLHLSVLWFVDPTSDHVVRGRSVQSSTKSDSNCDKHEDWSGTRQGATPSILPLCLLGFVRARGRLDVNAYAVS